MSKPVFSEKNEKYFNLSAVENFTRSAISVNGFVTLFYLTFFVFIIAGNVCIIGQSFLQNNIKSHLDFLTFIRNSSLPNLS